MTEYKIPAKFINPEWATYCERRKPKFKVHSTLGQAKNAVGVKKPHSEIQLLHFENGEWRVHWEYAFPKACPRCDGKFTNRWGYNTYNLPHRERRTSVMDAEVICDTCYYAEGVEISNAERLERERKEYERLKNKFGESV